MPKKKRAIHFAYEDGEAITACGLWFDRNTRITFSERKVTCGNCIRALGLREEKRQKQSRKRH